MANSGETIKSEKTVKMLGIVLDHISEIFAISCNTMQCSYKIDEALIESFLCFYFNYCPWFDICCFQNLYTKLNSSRTCSL